jgi:phospholipase C
MSPYAKKGYVDSNTYDTKSFLDIVQSSFGINGSTYPANHTNKMFQSFDFGQDPRPPIHIQEIPMNRIVVKPDEIYGINTIYILSLFVPILVTIYWYYRKQKQLH